MVKIIAPIDRYRDGRKKPFYTGYRRLFDFVPNVKISGQTNLINQDEFSPGENGEVEIIFLNKNYLGEDFDIEKTFFFYGKERHFYEKELLIQLFVQILVLFHNYI